jgi:hypothetical protein
LSDRVLGSKTSTALQTTLAAEAHLAEGQILLEEQTLNKGKSLVSTDSQLNYEITAIIITAN